jgi:DNA-nicking Smr family endonuclease
VRPPNRRLTPEEAELWAKVASTVRPFARPRPAADPPQAPANPVPEPSRAPAPPGKQPKRIRAAPPPAAAPPPPKPARTLDGHSLDANWDRKLARGLASPDFTLDLHGASLDGAYARLEHGLALAIAQQARVVLLITGRQRGQVDPADRSSRRGAIRAKFLGCLAHGSHASRIAAIRPAHPRHGGGGAVYIVLRKAGAGDRV